MNYKAEWSKTVSLNYSHVLLSKTFVIIFLIFILVGDDINIENALTFAILSLLISTLTWLLMRLNISTIISSHAYSFIEIKKRKYTTVFIFPTGRRIYTLNIFVKVLNNKISIYFPVSMLYFYSSFILQDIDCEGF